MMVRMHRVLQAAGSRNRVICLRHPRPTTTPRSRNAVNLTNSHGPSTLIAMSGFRELHQIQLAP